MKPNQYTILAFAPNHWHGQWMNRQQILYRLAVRGWNIVYSTGAIYCENWQNSPWKTKFHVDSGVNIIEPGRLPLRWRRNQFLDRLSTRWHINEMRRAHSGQKRTREKEILYVFHPKYYPYVLESNTNKLIYHVYDAYPLSKRWNTELDRMQKELVNRADIIFVANEHMANFLPNNAFKKIYIIENGADADLFSKGTFLPCPEDLKKIPHPRIGYVGSINRKVDLFLVAEIGKLCPAWHWVFVGKVKSSRHLKGDFYTKRGLDKCKKYQNIHFLGAKNHRELPAYMGNMDINTMCYRNKGEGWWIYGYPLKLHEYLATGKPIVSTDLESVKPYSNVIDIAKNLEEWIAALKRSLKGGIGSPEMRIEIAFRNDWEKRVDKIDEIVRSLT